MWAHSQPYTAVVLHGQNPPTEYARLPERNDVAQCKQDLLCFFNRCSCNNPKTPRFDGEPCLRGKYFTGVPVGGWADYIDNARGFRALPNKV